MTKIKKITSVFKSNPVSLAIVPIIVIVLSFGLNYAYATWSEPSGTPPNGNTDAPLNVGATPQTKTGILNLTNRLTVGNDPVGGEPPFTVNAAGDIIVTGGADAIFAFYQSINGTPEARLGFDSAGGMAMYSDWIYQRGFTNPSGYGNMVANDYYIGSIQKWASQLGSGGTPVSMYECPWMGLTSLGGGQWGYYGCVGQIQSQSTCFVVEWPHVQGFSCTYVGKMMLQP